MLGLLQLAYQACHSNTSNGTDPLGEPAAGELTNNATAHRQPTGVTAQLVYVSLGRQAAMRPLVHCVCAFVFSLTSVTQSFGEDTARQLPHYIDPRGIQGTLVIAGGGELEESILQRFVKMAGGNEAHIVLIPTASRRADDEMYRATLSQKWQGLDPASVSVLHTRSRDTASRELFSAMLQKATGVWIGGGTQTRITEVYLDTPVEREIYALLARGGVIGGSSAGAAVQSRVMIARGSPVAEVATGFALLPGSVIDQHFLARKRRPRLLSVLEKHPQMIGLGVDEGTALVVTNRRLEVVGRSTVTVCFAKTEYHQASSLELKPKTIVDLTALRRQAYDRLRPPFPAASPKPTHLPHGSLVIVGGGVLDAVAERFLELAGGKHQTIIVLPTAVPNPRGSRDADRFRRLGARDVRVLKQRLRTEVESEDYLATLRQAGGVWFSGGRQWRFVDAYYGTRALEEFHAVLRRGGAIGGSSAGASIQAEFLARGNPLGNRDIIATGYERGFGFLPGTAIDQHFTQRKRFADMTQLTKTHPQLLGIGIDEQTALVVHGDVGEVLGKHSVHFYNRKNSAASAERDYVSLRAGGKYDLRRRTLLSEPSEATQPATAD